MVPYMDSDPITLETEIGASLCAIGAGGTLNSFLSWSISFHIYIC